MADIRIKDIPTPEDVKNSEKEFVLHSPGNDIFDSLLKALEQKGWIYYFHPTGTISYTFHIVLTLKGELAYCFSGDCKTNQCTFGCNEKKVLHYDVVFKDNKLDNDPGIIPRNNDGRDTCYWCNVPTQKRGNGAYDVCPKCGK